MNLLLFAESIYMWLDSHPNHKLNFLDMKRLSKLVSDSKMGGVPLSYITSFYRGNNQNINQFFSLWQSCSDIVTANSDLWQGRVIPCSAPATVTWESLCSKEINFRFKFIVPGCHVRTESSFLDNCGFILTSSVRHSSTSISPGPDSPFFDIELNTSSKDLQKYSLHHHEFLKANNMHFIVEMMCGKVPLCLPLSWSDKPKFDGKDWSWGKFKFANDDRVKVSVLLF